MNTIWNFPIPAQLWCAVIQPWNERPRMALRWRPHPAHPFYNQRLRWIHRDQKRHSIIRLRSIVKAHQWRRPSTDEPGRQKYAIYFIHACSISSTQFWMIACILLWYNSNNTIPIMCLLASVCNPNHCVYYYLIDIDSRIVHSTSTSPSFSPGETTPKLPPKPRNPNFSAHNSKFHLLTSIIMHGTTHNPLPWPWLLY